MVKHSNNTKIYKKLSFGLQFFRFPVLLGTSNLHFQFLDPSRLNVQVSIDVDMCTLIILYKWENFTEEVCYK